MTRLLSTKRSRKITFISLIIFLLILVTTIFSLLYITNRNLNNTKFQESPVDPLLSNVPQSYSDGEKIIFNGESTGVKLNPQLDYTQSILEISECGESADSGYIDIKFENQDNLGFYLINKNLIGESRFMDYYSRFAGKIYSEWLPNLSILHPYCGGARHFKLMNNIENYSVNSTNYLNIAIGGYQYVPSSDESVNLFGSFHVYNPSNLIQVDFTLPELFKYNDVENYESCKIDETLMDLECFSELLNNNQEKVNLITNTANDIVNNLNIYFE